MLKYTQAASAHDAIVRGMGEVLAQGRTAFQEYLFFRSPEAGVCIVLDGDIQSCESDEAMYHEALVHPAMLLHPEPRCVLIMGGGEGATAREVLRHASVERVVMVDIDREFVGLCREHVPAWSAGALDDPRMELRHEDINAYLPGCSERFDVVIGDLVDVQDFDSPAGMLYGRELYGRLRECVGDDVVVATQAGALGAADVSGHVHIRDTLAGVFGHARSYGMVVPSFFHMWGFALATSKAPPTTDAELASTLCDRARGRGLELPAVGVDALSHAFTLPRQIRQQLG
ncbi:MAG: methyltransferase domain-containing protein [Myxococcales bacterium]|nr:methyltransferase domain-containing protein [Myxococcales bacterium]